MFSMENPFQAIEINLGPFIWMNQLREQTFAVVAVRFWIDWGAQCPIFFTFVATREINFGEKIGRLHILLSQFNVITPNKTVI